MSGTLETYYPVLIRERAGTFDLKIRELLLSARDTDLQRAYDELMRRKKELLEFAASNDAVGELTPPQLPSLAQPGGERPGFFRGIWKRLHW